VALLAALAIVAMLLTSGQMSDLRVALPPLSRAMSWLEGLPVPFDMDHVAFFALVAAVLRVLLPALRWWTLLLVLAALAVGTELLQFATIGRTPKLLDARDDMIGAGIGLLLGSVPLWYAAQAPAILRVSTGLLLAGIVLLPFQQWPVASAFGFPVLPSDALFVIALALRLFALAGGGAPVRISGFHGWLLAYVGAMLLAVLVLPPLRVTTGATGFTCPVLLPSPSFGMGLAKWVGVVYLGLLAALVCDLASRPEVAVKMAMAWVATACAASVLSIVAVVTFYVDRDASWLQPLLNHFGSLPPGDYPRVRVGFNYASMFANFLLVAVCLLLGLGWQGRSAQRACIASLLVIGVGMVPTLTPGLGGLPLAVGVAGWWWWRRHAPMRARIALVAGLLPALFMLLVASRSLLSPLDTPSQRWLLWSDALATIWTNPWRGIGLGQDVVGVSYLDPSGGQQWLTDAHNIVLNVTGQAGMPALLAFVGLCVWLCWRGLRPARAGNGVAAGALLALGVAVFYDGLTGSFEDARHVWVLVGLLAGAALACPPWMQPPPSTR
jgi:hypothetical protein